MVENTVKFCYSQGDQEIMSLCEQLKKRFPSLSLNSPKQAQRTSKFSKNMLTVSLASLKKHFFVNRNSTSHLNDEILQLAFLLNGPQCKEILKERNHELKYLQSVLLTHLK